MGHYVIQSTAYKCLLCLEKLIAMALSSSLEKSLTKIQSPDFIFKMRQLITNSFENNTLSF